MLSGMKSLSAHGIGKKMIIKWPDACRAIMHNLMIFIGHAFKNFLTQSFDIELLHFSLKNKTLLFTTAI